MTDDFETGFEQAAAARGWTSREGIVFDQATGEVLDAGRWELGLEEADDRRALSHTSGVRYIKLGPNGAWFDRCVRDGIIELGHSAVSHDLASAGDWADVKAIWIGHGTAPRVAASFEREVREFYTLPAKTLWLTIGRGLLWWGFAEPEVTSVHDPERGARARRIIGGWRSTDLDGKPLLLSELSTRLTQVAAYRQTLCSVDADYVLRRIKAEDEPMVTAAKLSQAAQTAAALPLIQHLHDRDFELLVDLICSTSGWRRVSAVGGSAQADTDLILEQAATGERAFVQVKSKADQAVLDDYIQRFEGSGMDRMIFACHSPRTALESASKMPVHLWFGDRLADQAVKAGLMQWLIDKNR